MTAPAPIIAVYDANVLYPAALRDFLIRLARSGLVGARWSDQIHDEWIRNLLINRPDFTPEQLERTRRLMDAAVPGGVVEGFEKHIPGLTLPDPDDRHVLAAAIERRPRSSSPSIPLTFRGWLSRSTGSRYDGLTHSSSIWPTGIPKSCTRLCARIDQRCRSLQ